MLEIGLTVSRLAEADNSSYPPRAPIARLAMYAMHEVSHHHRLGADTNYSLLCDGTARSTPYTLHQASHLHGLGAGNGWQQCLPTVCPNSALHA